MMRNTRVPSAALFTVLVGLTGCFKLSRTSPPVERYVVGGVATGGAATGDAATGGAAIGDAAATASGSSDLSLGLRRLDLAPYLATLAIVVRREDNLIVTTGFHRWAEAPSTGFNRAVAGYLAAAAGIRSVDVAPWPIRSVHDFIIQIRISRFEGVTGARAGAGGAHLLASWEIIRPADGAPIARGVTDFRSGDWIEDDYAGLVSRLDHGLLRVSQDIAACLQRLGPPVPDVAGAALPRSAPRECRQTQ